MALHQPTGEDDYSWSEEEDEEASLETEPCLCLFCKTIQSSAMSTIDHCRTEHNVDLLYISTQLACDYYSCIKLINYMRKECPPSSFLHSLPQPPYPWEDDSYLYPVLEQDPLLQVDWESESSTQQKPSSASLHNSVENYKTALSQALADLEDMRIAMKRMVGDTDTSSSKIPIQNGRAEEDEEEEEDGYFSTYSHFSIHLEMLGDKVRTEAYQNFITKNPAIFKDKVVLDIGCGTGILSLFAAQCGAKLVIGVDQSYMIYNAMQIVRENRYEDKITFIRGKMEEVQLPVTKVDVIISEWMGYFLLFESMLDTVIFSRDKWLIDTSHVYPNVCSMMIVAVSDLGERENRIDFWDNVYGFKMNCMKRDVLKEASVQCMEASTVISSTHTLKVFDVSKVTVNDLEFDEKFQLSIKNDANCHAIVGYFEAGFNGSQHSEYLKTGPRDAPTHWKQTVLYLEDPISVHTGDVFDGTLSVSRSKEDPRAIDIVLCFTHLSPSSLSDTSHHHTYSRKYILR